MKKLFSILVMMLCALTISAQEKDVTTFLGIPVDGSKPEMKKQLIAKGYTYNVSGDYFEGEFNGVDVMISIVTNNNKVYRIVLCDKNLLDEADIKNRFNILCHQFENNPYQKKMTSHTKCLFKVKFMKPYFSSCPKTIRHLFL